MSDFFDRHGDVDGVQRWLQGSGALVFGVAAVVIVGFLVWQVLG